MFCGISYSEMLWSNENEFIVGICDNIVYEIIDCRVYFEWFYIFFYYKV